MKRWSSVLLLVMGCGGASAEPATPNAAPEAAPAGNLDPSAQPTEMKPEWAKDVARAEALGRAMYEYDAAASVATDLLLAKFGDRPPVAGFLAAKDPGLVVYFFDRAGPGAAFRVVMNGDKPGPLEAVDGKKPLSSSVTAARRAFESASQVEFPRAPGPYNFVVLPGSVVQESGWLVYFLSAPQVPGEIVVGGHVRIAVSDDGKAGAMTPLAQSFLRIPPPPPNAVGAFVSHVLSDTPIETHVFLSLGMAHPLFVGTRAGAFKVARGHVSYLGQQKQH